MQRKGKPDALLVGLQIGVATIENSLEVPQKIKNRAAIPSSSSISGYVTKENRNTILKSYMHPYVHCRAIYNNHDMGATYVPIDIDDEWIKKMWYTHIYKWNITQQ